jgi:cytochrome c5
MQTDTGQSTSLRTLALLPLLAVLISLGSGCSDKQPADSAQGQASQDQASEVPAIQPAEQEVRPPAAEPEAAVEAEDAVAAAADGESVYKQACVNCHATGVANAPMPGDTAAWAPRLEKGNDALFESVKNGLNVMPPRGPIGNIPPSELEQGYYRQLKERP